MRFRGLYLLLTAACFFQHIKSFSQERDSLLITGDFKNLSITAFTEELQKQTGFYFYYDSTQFDSVKVNISARQLTLTKLLDQAFANTNFLYSIDLHKHVFFTKGQVIVMSLPEGFGGMVNEEKGIQKKSERATDIVSTEENAKIGKTVQRAVLENKLYVIGDPQFKTSGESVTLAGYVREAKSGEPVSGASIQVEKLNIGVSTDQYGYYSIILPTGRHIFNIQSIGMKDTRRQVLVNTAGKMDIELQGQVTTLKNVTVSAQKIVNVQGTQLGVQKIDIKSIKQVPVVFGEADILKVMLSLPGVKTAGEASTGLNVRGGSADQNLILFNDATIYNPSHFFGMFSAFNPEVVKDVALYKSSMPARYGGRLSSVLDIISREGNKKNITGMAGIGLLTSRVDIEGPLIKDKSSFIVGGRSTYANWLLHLLPDQYKNSKAGFYDINLNISHELGKKDNLYLTGYLSRDKFNLNSDTTYNYGNQNLSLKWKHLFNNRLNTVFTTGLDRYHYSTSSDRNPVNAYKFGFEIGQAYLKGHFNYYLSAAHTLDFGFSSIYYDIDPGSYEPLGKQSLVTHDRMESEHALETAFYLNDKYNLSAALSIEAGIRYTIFNYLGPKEINMYAPGLPKTVDNLTGTTPYAKGKFIKNYGGPEYRVSFRYMLSENFSLKAGLNTQRQYIHALSNTAAISPTDVWKLSDPNIKPQYGEQVSFGLYRNFKSNTIETSFETYFKRIKDYLDYKSGATLVMNHHIETDVINTKGKAYGAEFMIKKLTGKINGWISYTWSRILLKTDDASAGEIVNNGSFYPASYDKPHDITVIGNYRVNHRFSVSLNATYSTGRPITLPIGRYYYGGSFRTLYGDRNEFRIPDYFRMDFSMNIEGNHKVKQKTHNSWTMGVYNLTGRKNPYSIYYVSENGIINGYKLSIFGSAIPFVNFNIRF